MQDQTGASAISLGGGGVRSNNYLLDGFPVTDLQNRSSTNPSGEMVEDIRVQVHTYDAEMGRTGGGVLNTTAKSGVEFVPRLGLFPEPSERADRPAVLQPDSRHRERAAVLARGSAAALAGRCVKNKTFFWAAGEGYRDGLSQNDVMTRADDGDAQRRLQRPASTRRAGMIPIYDPLTTDAAGNRQPFPNNIIPQNRISPWAREYLKAIPLPATVLADRQRQPAGAGRDQRRGAAGLAEARSPLQRQHLAERRLPVPEFVGAGSQLLPGRARTPIRATSSIAPSTCSC